jgi:AcrR family transcriptional regulator
MANRKTPLTRERILKAATRVFEQSGPDALSARNLAAELGVSQMAVYRHFDSMDDLHGHLVDRVIRLQPLDMERLADDGWDQQLETMFLGVRRALLANPGIMPLLGTTTNVGDNALEVVESVLQVLEEAGFRKETAATSFHVLLSYTLGSCGIQSVASRSGGTREDTMKGLAKQLAEASFERVEEHAQELAAFMTEERFRMGLRLIIRGMKAELGEEASD